MIEEGKSSPSAALPVTRTKEEAKRLYDRISRYYDCLTVAFEAKHARRALEYLSIERGERVLEIGFGTGRCLQRIAEQVGQEGKAYGIDISCGMLEVARRRLEKAGLGDRVELHCGDASALPYRVNTFDAVFMSFTLELFDTPEIPQVLQEVKRVLKPGGRLGIASMSKEDSGSLLLRLYEWAHTRWPKYLDCRPIYGEQSLRDAGYVITRRERLRLSGLPIEIVVAVKTG